MFGCVCYLTEHQHLHVSRWTSFVALLSLVFLKTAITVHGFRGLVFSYFEILFCFLLKEKIYLFSKTCVFCEKFLKKICVKNQGKKENLKVNLWCEIFTKKKRKHLIGLFTIFGLDYSNFFGLWIYFLVTFPKIRKT